MIGFWNVIVYVNWNFFFFDGYWKYVVILFYFDFGEEFFNG